MMDIMGGRTPEQYIADVHKKQNTRRRRENRAQQRFNELETSVQGLSIEEMLTKGIHVFCEDEVTSIDRDISDLTEIEEVYYYAEVDRVKPIIADIRKNCLCGVLITANEEILFRGYGSRQIIKPLPYDENRSQGANYYESVVRRHALLVAERKERSKREKMRMRASLTEQKRNAAREHLPTLSDDTVVIVIQYLGWDRQRTQP